MNSNYKVIKFKKNKFEKIDDLISIEEPLEISIKYKEQNEWVTRSVSYDYLLSPIIFGCIIIIALAILINKFLLKKNYPLK